MEKELQTDRPELSLLTCLPSCLSRCPLTCLLPFSLPFHVCLFSLLLTSHIFILNSSGWHHYSACAYLPTSSSIWIHHIGMAVVGHTHTLPHTRQEQFVALSFLPFYTSSFICGTLCGEFFVSFARHQFLSFLDIDILFSCNHAAATYIALFTPPPPFLHYIYLLLFFFFPKHPLPTHIHLFYTPFYFDGQDRH